MKCLVFFLLISISCFAQKEYAELVVIEEETGVYIATMQTAQTFDTLMNVLKETEKFKYINEVFEYVGKTGWELVGLNKYKHSKDLILKPHLRFVIRRYKRN